MAARQASIFAWADGGEPITGNPQPKRSNASFEKNRELPPSIYKLALDITQGKTRSWNATSAVRPADLEADYAFLSPEPALESVARLPLYSRPYSAASTALAASVLTRCSEYSHVVVMPFVRLSGRERA